MGHPLGVLIYILARLSFLISVVTLYPLLVSCRLGRAPPPIRGAGKLPPAQKSQIVRPYEVQIPQAF